MTSWGHFILHNILHEFIIICHAENDRDSQVKFQMHTNNKLIIMKSTAVFTAHEVYIFTDNKFHCSKDDISF